MDFSDLIDLARYPIDRRGPELEQRIAEVRKDLAQDGCAVLRGFLTPRGIAALAEEAERNAVHAHRTYTRTNAYFTGDDPTLPETHPKRRFFDRSNAFVPADHFMPGGALRTVYDAPGFDAFVRDCLQERAFFRYADPLADAIVNVAEEGPGFPWHFDTNNFTVTLAIQNAESGGAFEYVPAIRDALGHENFDDVARVLDGTSDRVRTLHLQPGDLQLFRGRYSLHRVAPLAGPRPRYVAILSYVDQPDMVATPERAKQLYGRVLPIHFERAGRRSDTLID
ncbi:phytanoyl-CoA dioxygenase family protein [Limibaculum sp. M0105]|uniref:Phytanoyl-CoA dioxygenase family protein n=1 Tax=Thermohalobaculum xanthum TaxID=2753746 RepID=A0A8J7SGK5_9RHOB|nr:phytanoyl-CoA dioxygenase family protein [Thermohalobaculum xanthum]MBK0400981.1 phytanoyl-CoA dioxygenase family protein [Thermohalobaculum xanthum]